jgi:hypothetical protein
MVKKRIQTPFAQTLARFDGFRARRLGSWFVLERSAVGAASIGFWD